MRRPRLQGPICRIEGGVPSYMSMYRVHGDNENKKGSRLTNSEKPTLYPASFLYRGDEIGGKFIPMEVCIQADTLEAQEAVQAFLVKHGLKNESDMK